MAGGTFTSQNKRRPGAYINFKAVNQVFSILGTRGVMTMPVAMSWGDTVTELLSTDLADGKSVAKIGYGVADAECQIFREALKHCYKAIIYRLDTGGAKATKTLAPLTATAKYAGVVGNEIAISVVANGAKFDVITTFRGAVKDKQTVTTVAELLNNDWIVFSGTGNVVANAGGALTGGTNGSITDATYTTYANAIKSYKWNTMAIPQNSDAGRTAAITLITSMRDTFGKTVQAVLLNATADHEGIISNTQGYATSTETITPETFTAYLAGLTAGSDITKSNTYHVISGATSITYLRGTTPYGDAEIEAQLALGNIVLSTRQDGAIVIEQDINKLHNFGADRSYSFSKNRVIRTLDAIANSAASLYENVYLGKVDNNDAGRTLFKADLIAYLRAYQDAGAIQNFDSGADITVYAGQAIDAVVVDLSIQPVDSMEKLYMTVLVG